MFEINALSGVLRTVASLDREEQDTYILDIQAMDSAGVNSLSSITEVRTYVVALVTLHNSTVTWIIL